MNTLLVGDCIASLKTLPDQSVHTCITSPPYFGLRDYGMDGQIGLEDTPEAFVARLVEVFREVHRVLRDDGTLWVNLGDSYNTQNSGAKNGIGSAYGKTTADAGHDRPSRAATGVKRNFQVGLKPKDLIGIPWRVAFALQADGWCLRQDIIWHKPNPMPESVTDRCTKAHEYIFLFSKSPKYFFDHLAMKEPGVYPAGTKGAKGYAARQAEVGVNARPPEYKIYDGLRNKRSVWTVNTKPFKGAHFATFPTDLIEPCILAGAPENCCPACGAPHHRQTSRGVEARQVDGSEIDRFGDGNAGVHRKVGSAYQKWMNENPLHTVGWKPTCSCVLAGVPVGGVVLDPFFGAGTTGLVAQNHGRAWIGCELNPEYADIARSRLGIIPACMNKDALHIWLVAA